MSLNDSNRDRGPQQLADTKSKESEMVLDASPSCEKETTTMKPGLFIDATKNFNSETSAMALEGLKARTEECDVEMTSERQGFEHKVMDTLESRECFDTSMTSIKAQPSSASNTIAVEETPLIQKSRQEADDVHAVAQQIHKISSTSGAGALKAISAMIESESTRPDDRKTDRNRGPSGSTYPKDEFSYSIPVVSPEQQAIRELDFIGTADYYDVRYDEVQQSLGGTYFIVYSRALDKYQEPCGDYEVYPTSCENSIAVSSTGAATPVPREKGKSVFHEDIAWAEGEIDFNNRFYTFRLEQRWSSDGIQAACVSKQEFPGNDSQACLLDRTLDMGINPKLTSTARFGSKYMRTEKAWDQDYPARLGFKFIVLDLGTWDFTTNGNACFRRVVGVKIPDRGDVASGFLLNQRITWSEYGHEIIHVRGYPPSFAHASRNAQKTPKLADVPEESQRKQEKSTSSRAKHKSWAEQAEACGKAVVKDRKKKGSGSGARMIREDEPSAGLRRR